MGNEEEVNRGDLRVKPDVYMAALMDEVNEHLVELIDKMDAANKQSAPHTKHYTTPETAILVATPDVPNSPDTISDPATATPGYQAHTIYETLQRMAPTISVINDGTDTIFVISTSDGKSWTPENPIFSGESRTFYNVYELRLRSPTGGDTTSFTGGVYRLTEYQFTASITGMVPNTPAYTALVNAFSLANSTAIIALMFGAPQNASLDTIEPLGAGATYFGEIGDFEYSRLGFMGALAASDVVSATAGFRIQQTNELVTGLWVDEDAITTTAVSWGFAGRVKSAIATRYARVAYTNGGGAQDWFTLGSRVMIS